MAEVKVHYDETPVVGATLDDLNLVVFSRYYRDQFEEPLDEFELRGEEFIVRIYSTF